MILSHIAAMAENRVIGKDNQLPWNIPEDLKFFKDTTQGKILIMGRKTFESLPKPLPNRFHIVISRISKSSDNSLVYFCKDISSAIEKARSLQEAWPEEVFVVGGGEIYKQTLPYVNKLYLTKIHQDFMGDAYYPEFEKSDFHLQDSKKIPAKIPLTIEVYERISTAPQK